MFTQYRYFTIVFIALLAMGLISPVASGQKGDVDFSKVVEKVRPAVVQIVTGEEHKGSGFIIHPSGYVLTAYHVVEDAKEITVKVEGDEEDKEYEAELVYYHGGDDIALLEIKGQDLPALELADSKKAKLGSEVIALGYPAPGDSLTVTKGLLSSIREDEGGKTFQISSPVNPGNSGGPLLNSSGEVLGIVFAKADVGHYLQHYGTVPEGIGFAIPIEKATNYFGIDESGKPHIKKIDHYEEDFTDPKSGWPIIKGDAVTKKYGDKSYNVEIKKADVWTKTMVPVPVSPKEFTFEVSVKSNNDEGAYGIIFGYQDSDNYYWFIASPYSPPDQQHGYYAYDRKSQGGWSARGEWDGSASVNPDGVNTMKVEVSSDNNIRLFVNNRQVKYIMMEFGYKGGRLGLVTWGFEKGFKAKFLNLSLDIKSRTK